MCDFEKRDNLFFLTITGDDEHTLNPTLIDAIRLALKHVKLEFESELTRSTAKCALILTNQGIFFSSGYDIQYAQSDPSGARNMSENFRLLVADLISFPILTIAAVNGHASGAGFILALCFDKFVMRSDLGYLQLNVFDPIFEIPIWFTSVLKNKIAIPKVWIKLAMIGEKMDAEKGVRYGVVDYALEDEEDTIDKALKLGNEFGIMKEVHGRRYGIRRNALLSDVVAALASDETV